jgi:hypothetical protein
MTEQEQRQYETLLEENKALKTKLRAVEKRMGEAVTELEDYIDRQAVRLGQAQSRSFGYYMRRLPTKFAQSSKVARIYGKLKKNKYLYQILNPIAKIIKRYR